MRRSLALLGEAVCVVDRTDPAVDAGAHDVRDFLGSYYLQRRTT